jgi:methyl coenzyme M reductase subunit D
MPVILATWEAEIVRIMVQGQPGPKVSETASESISQICIHPQSRSSKCEKKLMEMEREIDKSIVTVEDFNILLSIIERIPRQKKSRILKNLIQ